MNKYKVEFVQTEKFIVDVRAKTEENARKRATEIWNNGNYQETGDIEVELNMVYDVTHTDDPFNPINECN